MTTTLNAERWVRWCAVLGLGLVGGACRTQPPPDGDKVSCDCECEDACKGTDVQGKFLPGGQFDLWACTSISANFGPPIGDGAILSSSTITGCAPIGGNSAQRTQACRNECEAVNTISWHPPDTLLNQFVAASPDNRLAKSRRCQLKASATPVVTAERSCRQANFASASSALTATESTLETAAIALRSQNSQGEIHLDTEFSHTVIPVPAPSGRVVLRGGNCPGASCEASLDYLEVRVAGFMAEDQSIGATVITNDQPILGTKTASGALTFPSASLNAVAASSQNGAPTFSALVADRPLTGSYDPVTGALRFTGAFADTGTSLSQSVVFDLAGQATARPPIVRAGADQAAACPAAGGPATAAVNGSQTADPDGDAVSFVWSENGTVLARTAVATLSLTAGAHDVLLTATDATGRSGRDAIRVTVSDGVAPRFTFVPPTVVLETTGPASIGQAIAADGCGSVTVSNDAPASFPIGLTVVTWSATDASGNRATAVQKVYVLPGGAASCPPGSRIILGTSNDDVLTGTEGPDCIVGFGGQDRIDGRGGNDTILGGDGDDVITGGGGDDTIAGGPGQDVITGNAGSDLLAGNDGDDVIGGGDGNDTLAGGSGQDRLNGDAGDDVLVGNAGDDRMDGGAGTDRCVTDLDHDVLAACE